MPRRANAATERRGSSPPLRHDWRRVDLRRITRNRRQTRYRLVSGDYAYTAQPDQTYALDVWRGGGSWRWSLVLLPDGNTIHESGRPMPTLIRAKHAAEQWYAEHGGKAAQEEIIWLDVPTEPAPF